MMFLQQYCNDEKLSVNKQESFPTAMTFNADGTKLYVTGTRGGDINTYDLVNFTPILVGELADVQIYEDAPFALIIDVAVFEDPNEGDELEMTVFLEDGSELPDWLTFNSDTATLSGTPENDDVATLSIVVTATDLGDLSVTDVFELEVIHTNDPHTIDPVSTQAVKEHNELRFTVTVTDEDIDNPDYTCSLDASSTALGISIDDDGAFSWTPDDQSITSAIGSSIAYNVTLTVEDDENIIFKTVAKP